MTYDYSNEEDTQGFDELDEIFRKLKEECDTDEPLSADELEISPDRLDLLDAELREENGLE